jgi:5'-3' exonuclease
MGIERFFSALSKRYKDGQIVEILNHPYSRKNINYLFFDFNSFVYGAKERVLGRVNQYLELIIKKKTDEIFNDEENITRLTELLNCQDLLDAIDFDREIIDLIRQVKDYFNTDRLDHDIILVVFEKVYNMLNTNFNVSEIKRILIAIDGTPSKSKMIEQKKRRYMGEFTSQIKDKLIEKHRTELEEKGEYMLTKFSITWDTKRISPGTQFMHLLSNSLHSDTFIGKISEILPNLEIAPIISDVYTPGEGEMKIIDYIIEKKEELNGTIAIYSPDSDVILLGLILQNKLLSTSNQVFVLRYDQNASKEHSVYQFVNCRMLITKLREDITNSLERMDVETDLQIENAINDIVLLFTVFGNDFLPKINSIDVRNDMDFIFWTYPLIIRENLSRGLAKPYIINQNDELEKLEINVPALEIGLNVLSSKEDNFLTRNYFDNTYFNYSQVASILKRNFRMRFYSDTFEYLSNYFFFRSLDILNKFSEEIYKKYNDESEEITTIEGFYSYLKEDGEYQHFNNNVENGTENVYFNNFIGNFKNFVKQEDFKKIGETNSSVIELLDLTLEGDYLYQFDGSKILDYILLNYFINQNNLSMKTSKFVNVQNMNRFLNIRNKDTFGLIPQTHTFEDKKYKSKMKRNGINRNNPFEVEFFEMENMINEYYVKMNAEDTVQLGQIDDLEESKERYYQQNFGLSYSREDRNIIANDYLLGINWVFQYYFNGDSKYLYWYYPHLKAPLLQDISNFLRFTRENDTEKYMKLFNDYSEELNQFIPQQHFFTPLEQLFYVCPFDSINLNEDSFNLIKGFIPDEVITKLAEFIQKEFDNIDMKTFYFSVTNVVNKVLSEDGPVLEIDCKGVLYQNKCILTQMVPTETIGYDKYLKNFRSLIPLSVQSGFIPNIQLVSSGYKKYLINYS